MKLKSVLVYFNVWNAFEVIYAPASMYFSLSLSFFPPFFFFLTEKKNKIKIGGVNWISRLHSQTL